MVPLYYSKEKIDALNKGYALYGKIQITIFLVIGIVAICAKAFGWF